MNNYTLWILIVDGISLYHVINTETRAIQSKWKTYPEAVSVLRELNRRRAI